MAEIDDLVVRISADFRDLKKQLDIAGDQVKKFGGKTKRQVRQLN